MDSYFAPIGIQRFTQEVKRSQFITTFIRVNDKTEAKATIRAINVEFPGANHHCWAMIAGAPNDFRQMDQSDDGEPKGTAGKPMLNVLQHAVLGNVCCVVTRYFGGIKLGAGGLVRAYSNAVSQHIASLELERCVKTTELCLQFSYPLLGIVENWLQQQRLTIVDTLFTDTITMRVNVPLHSISATSAALREMTQGNIIVTAD